MALILSAKIKAKLKNKHGVTEDEVLQCFVNRYGKSLEDTRVDHKTDPPTYWMISQTDYGRSLKIVFIEEGDDIFLKSAFEPNPEEIRIYDKYGADG